MGADISVSIIVVTYNAPDKAQECLDALTGSGKPTVTYEVIALDNASQPSLIPLLREYLPSSCVVDASENLGFARGCNAAAERARGRFLIFLNPDAVIHPGAIDELVRLADSMPDVGVLGGGLVDPQGRTDPKSSWGAPSAWSYFCFATGLSTLFRASELFNPEALGGWDRETARDVPIVTGCLMLVPRAVWQQLGGFDDRYFMYGEDADLCLRARQSGRRVRFDPSPRALHHWGASSGSSGNKTTLLLAGRMTYVIKNFSGWRQSSAVASLKSGVALRAAAAVLLRRRDNGWGIAWRRRSEWLTGYPPI